MDQTLAAGWVGRVDHLKLTVRPSSTQLGRYHVTIARGTFKMEDLVDSSFQPTAFMEEWPEILEIRLRQLKAALDAARHALLRAVA